MGHRRQWETKETQSDADGGLVLKSRTTSRDNAPDDIEKQLNRNLSKNARCV